ncbi:hypothetical protein CRG98_005731 [Punica granatum]|uniref:Uncharacterized protein n=1 Tax=Punica granatum TaxID=22663 RepID=A0A2I0KZH2_PUNGR|nr:hypothetical protein CRG98_005731 [Punica granatum]
MTDPPPPARRRCPDLTGTKREEGEGPSQGSGVEVECDGSVRSEKELGFMGPTRRKRAKRRPTSANGPVVVAK